MTDFVCVWLRTLLCLAALGLEKKAKAEALEQDASKVGSWVPEGWGERTVRGCVGERQAA